VKAETLVNTLPTTLSETDVDPIGDKLGNVQSAEVKHTLTDTPEKAKTGRLSIKLYNNKAKALLAKECDMQTLAEAKTNWNK